MSDTAKLIRGFKWSLQKRVDGSYPDGIEKNEDRWNELQEYLKFIEGKEETEIRKAIINLRVEQRKSKRNSRKIKELENFLRNKEPARVEQEVKEEKKTKKEAK
jgi:hypothetical protein